MPSRVRSSVYILLAVLAVPALSVAETGKRAAAHKSQETPLERRRRLRNDRILSREELERAIAPHVPAIQGCYKTHAAKQKRARGELRLEMLIRPEGVLQKLWVVAPGVRGDGLSKCIKKNSESWRFPEKPGFTNAVLPFFFLKTHAEGAGPLHSCWSAKGCPDKTRRK